VGSDLTSSGMEVADKNTVVAQLGSYLDLLLRWNARTNLTAIREPEAIVQRHFGESLFAARMLAKRLSAGAALLDFGSGAGFPGLPIQIYLPELRVTLAESQGKKAAFLREAVRTLGLKTEVWSDRVESMPMDRRFDCVALRAVDRMADAVSESKKRVAGGGTLAVLAGAEAGSGEKEAGAGVGLEVFDIPASEKRRLFLYRFGA
jgi:16S rRNA (guanine527-N7)-methyltransferase